MDLVQHIRALGWWQGSVIDHGALAAVCEVPQAAEYWIVTTQTCNLYSADFEQIPVFEVVAATRIDDCSGKYVKGDNPRTLHVKAEKDDAEVALSVNILNRLWLPRKALASIAPAFHIVDQTRDYGEGWRRNQWLDLFSGWMGRSYTRVALPDEFNIAFGKSKIAGIIQEKLVKRESEIYGVFISIAHDSEEEWDGVLGLMLPPYLLELMVVVYKDVDPDPIQAQLIQQLFNDKVEDNTSSANPPLKVTRGELAAKHNIRINKNSVSVRVTTEVNLDDLRHYIRYSLIDHLSEARQATEL